MNKTNFEGIIKIKEHKEENNLYFVNGFILEENQKMKFSYCTKIKENIQKINNLDNTKCKIKGTMKVKYAKHNFVFLKIESIYDMDGNLLVVEE